MADSLQDGLKLIQMRKRSQMVAIDAPADGQVFVSLQLSESIDPTRRFGCLNENVKGGLQVSRPKVGSGHLQHAALPQPGSGSVGDSHEVVFHSADCHTARGEQ